MAKSKAKPASPFTGRWHIVSMTEWDEDFINAEVQGFIEFEVTGSGSFQFGYVQGEMDCHETTRLSSGPGKATTRWTRRRVGVGR